MKGSREPDEEVGKRVGIWIRISKEMLSRSSGTDGVQRSESPEHHRKRAELYAEMKAWTVVEVYELIGVSGKDVARHPEAQRMLKDVERGHISGLIFSKLARLGRKTDVLLRFLQVFKDNDADLISLDESIDTTTPAGRHFFRLQASNAEWEREEIAERVQASVSIRARLGKPLGGRAPFGYSWQNKVLVLDPEEAAVRRLIYEWFLETGGRLRTVTNRLNQAGYRTRKGQPFTHSAIRWMIQDPIAKGVRRTNYTRMVKGAPHAKPEDEWSYVETEPIVSEEVWTQANMILASRKMPEKRPTKRTAHLFSGLVFCATCGEKMYVPSNSPKYTCRTCRAKIPTGDLETVFIEQLHAFLLSEDQLGDFLADADQKLTEKAELLSSLERERAKVDREMKKVYSLYMEDQITSTGFGQLYRPLEERAEQLDQEIPRLQGEIDATRLHTLTSQGIAHEAQTLYETWKELDPIERRSIVELVTRRIDITRDEIILHLCYIPPPEDMANGSRHRAETAPPVSSAGSGSLAKRPASLPAPEGASPGHLNCGARLSPSEQTLGGTAERQRQTVTACPPVSPRLFSRRRIRRAATPQLA
jgi:site-specific DNA recombinase